MKQDCDRLTGAAVLHIQLSGCRVIQNAGDFQGGKLNKVLGQPFSPMPGLQAGAGYCVTTQVVFR